MKEYTSNEPVFSPVIHVVETSDPAHADNINAAPMQLLQNTIANRLAIAGLLGFTYEGNGILRNIIGCVYDEEMLIIPSELATVDGEVITLSEGNLLVGSGGSSGGGSGGEGYVLPVATASRLGGVKIGEGIDSSPDGTISVDKMKLLDETIASESDTEEMLSGIFGQR